MLSVPMVGYYDYVLGLVPTIALSVAVALTLAGVSLPVAIAAGVGLTVPLVGHALFVRAPVPTTQSALSEPAQSQPESGPTRAD